jgi:uncharacterized tellurite resistance protein B-like protein
VIDLMKKFFSKDSISPSQEPRKGTSHDVRVATCALFLEMAHIDGEFSDTEREHIIQALKKDHGLSEEAVAELLNASQKELKGSIDLWQFTNLINQNYTLEEKIRIIEMVWQLAYTDGTLDKHEDYLLHKMANLLRLSHKQLIEAKLKVLQGGNPTKERSNT